MRVLPAAALLAALMPGQGVAQRQVAVAPGAEIPNLRLCIDYAGEGWLRMTGETTPDPDPEAIVDHPTYHFAFTERHVLFGASAPQPFALYQNSHSPRRVDVKDALVFVQRLADGQTRFVAWQWVWTDRHGRKFVPIFNWANPLVVRFDWQSPALRRFLRPVSYVDPQPYYPTIEWFDHWQADDEEAAERDRLFDTAHGRHRVRYGLYLSDVPAMLAAADAEEDCWR